MKPLKHHLFAWALVAAMPTAIASVDSERRLGDHLSFALPLGTVAYELWRGDREGAWQLTQTLVLTVGVAELLKNTTDVERPDGSNNKSFPSGHAARVFPAAAYMRQRHGFEKAWPLYVAATYVGYTRVQAKRHRWQDVAASALLAEGMAHWRVTPLGAEVLADVSANGATVSLQWRLD
jgi:membrane-associated phospholipid phosphatase